jgi:hypothetical protein
MMTPTPTTAAIITAAIAAIVAITKKLLPRKSAPKPKYITRAEFHEGLDTMRDRIGAGYLAVAEKLDANHRELLSALDRQGSRINELETGVARLDECTRVTH